MTEASPTADEAVAPGSLWAAVNKGIAVPAQTTSAALFKIVRRPMAVPLLNGIPGPLFFFIIAHSLIFGL